LVRHFLIDGQNIVIIYDIFAKKQGFRIASLRRNDGMPIVAKKQSFGIASLRRNDSTPAKKQGFEITSLHRNNASA
jgi:hypothetical protein